MKKLLKNRKLFLLLFCFFLSFIVLFFTSKCSPLYPINDWVDANAFFTVGKSMMNGVVPYKDLFEQKGLFLYFIYGIGYLITNTSFLGVFLLEILFFTIFLYYVFKIFTLFVKERYASFFLPIIAALLCISDAFVHGGGAEEFCLAMIAISFYYFLVHLKKKELSYPLFFLNGIMAGLVLMTKYTLLGFWVAFMACLFFDLVFKKKVKKAVFSALSFLGGMFLPLGISLLYMAVHHGIYEFFHTYFYLNMTSYGEMTVSMMERLKTILIGFFDCLKDNGIVMFLTVLIMPVSVLFLPLKKSNKAYLVLLYVFSMLGIFYGLKFYRYYIFPMLFFSIPTFLVIAYYFDKWLGTYFPKIIWVSLTGIILLFSFFLSYHGANYKEFRSVKKEDLFQYQFAEIIKKEKNPTLVNMGYLDCGVYTTTGIVPSTYFFERQNFRYDAFPDNLDSFARYIENQDTMFIVYFTGYPLEELKMVEMNLFSKYDMIKESEQRFEDSMFHAYLFRVKE